MVLQFQVSGGGCVNFWIKMGMRFPNNVNSSNLYDWGEDRRRVVVLNLVRN